MDINEQSKHSALCFDLNSIRVPIFEKKSGRILIFVFGRFFLNLVQAIDVLGSIAHPALKYFQLEKRFAS